MTNSKIKLNLDSLKSRKEWLRHKVKDGHNIFRIAPPFGESSNGYPYRKWVIIWGLNDAENGRARPFASSVTSEKRCPVTEFVDQLKVRAETMATELKAAGTSDEDVHLRLKDLQELIGRLSPKTVYVYNAIDKSGQVGLLELKSTAHKSMKARMNEYINDYNQDPTSLNSADDDSGLWFDVIRSNETGKFRDTKYEVKKVQAKIKAANGSVSFVDDRSPLPDSVVENYANLAYDLSSIYQTKSYDELQQVLEANLPNIIELVPDADLSVEPSLKLATAPAQKAASPKFASKTLSTPATKPSAARVAIKLDDEDDDQEVVAVTNGTVAKAADDDFMAQADAILNS